MSDTVLVEDQGAVRVLTLNRPTKLNAMNVELVDTLIGAVRAADQDDAVAVVIVTGAGRAFSAGADISRGTTEPSSRPALPRRPWLRLSCTRSGARRPSSS
jgi:enoyl-CoA hydratase/carnithine racemase